MKVVFQCAIDAYKTNCWPTSTGGLVPAKGDFIEVVPVFHLHFASLRLPRRLEVVSVTWQEYMGSPQVVCELHYNKLDAELMRNAGTDMYP